MRFFDMLNQVKFKLMIYLLAKSSQAARSLPRGLRQQVFTPLPRVYAQLIATCLLRGLEKQVSSCLPRGFGAAYQEIVDIRWLSSC
jgi:hypothetical protein